MIRSASLELTVILGNREIRPTFQKKYAHIMVFHFSFELSTAAPEVNRISADAVRGCRGIIRWGDGYATH